MASMLTHGARPDNPQTYWHPLRVNHEAALTRTAAPPTRSTAVGAERRSPEAAGGVPGTDVEIGGGSPDLEPDRGNPTSKARAWPGIDRAVPSAAWLCAAGASVRAGLKEALDALWWRTKVKRRKAFRDHGEISAFHPGRSVGSRRGWPVGRRTKGRRLDGPAEVGGSRSTGRRV